MNANLVKQEEKATLARLVQIMIDLGLRFVRDKTEDGQPTFKLEPPIDVFIHYDGKRAGDVAAARYAVRQLIAQAVSNSFGESCDAADSRLRLMPNWRDEMARQRKRF